MLNNKGYTLIELLATMVIIGVVMGVTIPNITGISAQNKMTAYAEDAKKFKNTAEYMFRGDDTVKKPTVNEQCVMVNLKYLHDNEFDNPPHGGSYDMMNSFVVMVKKNNRYYYYVQLVEKFDADGDNYKGFSLIDHTALEGSKYLDEVDEGTSMAPFVSISDWGNISTILQSSRTSPSTQRITGITGCTSLLEVYYEA